MKLKGNWSADGSYNVGDIVVYDGVVYILQNPAISGETPKSTLCWNRLDQELADCVFLIMDALSIAQEGAAAEVEKYFLNDQTLLLKTGEGESITTYAIMVDDTGDTPELAVEEVSEEGES